MASTYETGCIQNVANLETLISYITAFGTDYNPSKNSLTIPELQKILSEAKVSLNTVNVAFSAHSNATAARESAFEPLSKLVTRANNALKATDTTTQVDDSAKTIVRKLQGSRANAKITEEEKKALEAEGKAVWSTLPTSYDVVNVENGIIKVDPKYAKAFEAKKFVFAAKAAIISKPAFKSSIEISA